MNKDTAVPPLHGNRQTDASGSGERSVHVVFSLLGLFVMVISFLLPSGKLPISLCSFYTITGLPCPGCGLTRSIVYISHLSFEKAFRTNPMGFPIYVVLFLLALYNFIPAKPRARLDVFIRKHHRTFVIMGILILTGMFITWLFRLFIVYDRNLPYLDRL
jgi:hypothetical protein